MLLNLYTSGLGTGHWGHTSVYRLLAHLLQFQRVQPMVVLPPEEVAHEKLWRPPRHENRNPTC